MTRSTYLSPSHAVVVRGFRPRINLRPAPCRECAGGIELRCQPPSYLTLSRKITITHPIVPRNEPNGEHSAVALLFARKTIHKMPSDDVDIKHP